MAIRSKLVSKKSRGRKIFSSLAFRVCASLLLCLSLTLTGCFQTNEGEPYYGRVTTPRAQEFRWSDGGLPQTFDPALAAAPPDTDAVRALFEGLTDYDPQTLAAVPGVAARWESSDDKRVWTFYLRRDARWTNGDAVTANDFVRSWQRSLGLGTRAPHAHLLENIVGATPQPQSPATTAATEQAAPAAAPASAQTPRRASEKGVNDKSAAVREPKKDAAQNVSAFGAEAVNDYTLRVRLQQPDGNFPALVAHPIFRPVHNVRDEEGTTVLAEPIVSNGPFRLTQVASDGVTLERAASYWDAQTVNLNRVRFIPTGSAEEALDRYRAGDVDVVTNAGFEPLALKLLAPYKDFRRATFGALTFYKFNTEHVPFNDVRVREALAIAIDRERISEDQMDGASEPAQTFLPTQSTDAQSANAARSSDEAAALSHDIARAKSLLAEAGYPQGAGFPRVQLLVNRNEQQRQIAQSIASMWRKALGIETDVVLKNWDEYETAVNAGEYDVVRKGMVMQTMDEASNMRAMFEETGAAETVATDASAAKAATSPAAVAANTKPGEKSNAESQAPPPPLRQTILSQADALKSLPAIPIYFASSYSLVKPYVVGFDNNLLDAPSLKRVRLDTSWQAPKRKEAVWFKVGE